MGSRTRGNLGGTGYGCSRQDWAAHKFNPRKLVENGRFTNKDDLNLYLSGDLITCLECLQDCRSLGQHLSRNHAMSSLEYKKKYNIPKGRSLLGESTRKKSSESAKNLWVDAEERRQEMRQLAQTRLVGIGTFAPRISHFESGYNKNCPTCSKPFIAPLKKIKFCSKVCHIESPGEQKRLRQMAQHAGKVGAATSKRNSLGRFSNKFMKET